MSAFHGPQKPGAMKERREVKRREAEERNATTPHKRTRAHREFRCNPATHLVTEVFGEESAAS